MEGEENKRRRRREGRREEKRSGILGGGKEEGEKRWVDREGEKQAETENGTREDKDREGK